jgi:protein TonB
VGIFDANPDAGTPASTRRRRGFAAAVSALVHAAVLLLLVWRPAVLVTPQLIARGEGGTATPLSVALYLPRDVQASAAIKPSPVSVPARIHKMAKQRRSNVLANDQPVDSAETGSREGSALAGSLEGEDVRPAIPLPGSFEDPAISRWELPAGVEGDVIVELTINDQGIVVDEKLLQGIGHGVDERVIAALRGRRYRPATRNGIAIPSKQDFYRHFPS